MSAASWEPIGTYDGYTAGKYFGGSFDGQGHKITYKITDKTTVGAPGMLGLFGIAEAEISNLTVAGEISGFTRTQASYIGGLCGYLAGYLTNCVSEVMITSGASATSNASFYGGVTGQMVGEMTGCLYKGTINLAFASAMGDCWVGGLSGTLCDGMIYACKNEGNITVSNSGSSINGNAGGIVGMAHTGGDPVSSEVKDCYNTGNVEAKNSAGGIAGAVSAVLGSSYPNKAASSRIFNCYSSTESITSTSGKTGAIAHNVSSNNYTTVGTGTATATVDNCYYTTDAASDNNATKVTDMGELYTKLSASAEAGVWLQDSSGTPRLYWEFKTNPTPEAVFTATGDNGGTLSNVDASMKYSIDGGATWNEITGTSVDLTGVTADNDIKVYRPGDGDGVLDSETQTIDVTKAEKPAVGAVNCTTTEQNNGQITGVDSTMEYKLSTAEDWTAITDTVVTGLADGTYDVRVKANGTALASDVSTVTIAKHTCVAKEGWSSDEKNHWNTCECGEKLNVAAHSFEWVVDKEATASEKGSKHEKCTVCGYEKAAVEIPTGGTAKPGKPSGSNASSAKKATGAPKTGDQNGLAIWTILLIGSGAAVILAKKKKAVR